MDVPLPLIAFILSFVAGMISVAIAEHNGYTGKNPAVSAMQYFPLKTSQHPTIKSVAVFSSSIF